MEQRRARYDQYHKAIVKQLDDQACTTDEKTIRLCIRQRNCTCSSDTVDTSQHCCGSVELLHMHRRQYPASSLCVAGYVQQAFAKLWWQHVSCQLSGTHVHAGA